MKRSTASGDEVLARVAGLFHAGVSIKRIVEILERCGFRGRGGALLTTRAVRRLLKRFAADEQRRRERRTP